MNRALTALAVVFTLVTLVACAQIDRVRHGAEVGHVMARHQYLVDLDVPLAADQWLYVGAEQDVLAQRLEASGLDETAHQVRSTDGTLYGIVTVTFNACGNDEPQLRLDDGTVQVRFGTRIDRECYRPIDTLVLFSVTLTDLPDPTTFRLCSSPFVWAGGEVTGQRC